MSSVHLKRACEISIFIFLKINKNSHVRSTKFSSRIKKISIIWKTWTFYPGLKFQLWLVKPSWNFNLLSWVEIFTCNCNVILQSSLLFSRNKFSTRYIERAFKMKQKGFFDIFTPLSANPTNWTNTLKQFAGKLPRNCWVCLTISWDWRLKG